MNFNQIKGKQKLNKGEMCSQLKKLVSTSIDKKGSRQLYWQANHQVLSILEPETEKIKEQIEVWV
jgi:DNA-binding transcriptional regulator GbsR (MarR family)